METKCTRGQTRSSPSLACDARNRPAMDTTRRQFLELLGGGLIAAAAPGSSPSQPLPTLSQEFLPGVNLAVGEFNQGAPNGGVYGVDYAYPTHAEIDYYAGKGLK